MRRKQTGVEYSSLTGELFADIVDDAGCGFTSMSIKCRYFMPEYLLALNQIGIGWKEKKKFQKFNINNNPTGL